MIFIISHINAFPHPYRLSAAPHAPRSVELPEGVWYLSNLIRRASPEKRPGGHRVPPQIRRALHALLALSLQLKYPQDAVPGGDVDS